MVLVSSNISILSVFKSARNFYPKMTLGLYKLNFGCQMKPSPQNTIWNSKTLEKLSKTCGPELGHFDHLRAVGDCTKRGTTGHGYCTHAGGMGGGHPDEAGREISRPTAAVRAGSGRRSGGGGHRESQEVFQFSGHFPAISGHPIALFHHFWTP